MKKQKAKKKKNARRLSHGPGCNKPAETLGKHYTKRSGKRLSPKQKKALAKGRKVLTYLRSGRAASAELEPLLIKEGSFMAAKKKSKKHSGKHYGFEGAKHHAKKKTVHHKVSHVLSGAGKGGFDAGGMAVDLAGLIAGAIGLSLVSGFIPVKNPKMKSLIPIALGIVGLSMPKLSKNRFINRAALGGLAIGGYSLTKQLAPGLPLMGATDTAEGIGNAIQALPPEEQAILGLLPDYSETAGDDTEIAGAPGEMLGESDELEGVTMLEGMPGEMLGEPGDMLGM